MLSYFVQLYVQCIIDSLGCQFISFFGSGSKAARSGPRSSPRRSEALLRKKQPSPGEREKRSTRAQNARTGASREGKPRLDDFPVVGATGFEPVTSTV